MTIGIFLAGLRHHPDWSPLPGGCGRQRAAARHPGRDHGCRRRPGRRDAPPAGPTAVGTLPALVIFGLALAALYLWRSSAAVAVVIAGRQPRACSPWARSPAATGSAPATERASDRGCGRRAAPGSRATGGWPRRSPWPAAPQLVHRVAAGQRQAAGQVPIGTDQPCPRAGGAIGPHQLPGVVPQDADAAQRPVRAEHRDAAWRRPRQPAARIAMAAARSGVVRQTRSTRNSGPIRSRSRATFRSRPSGVQRASGATARAPAGARRRGGRDHRRGCVRERLRQPPGVDQPAQGGEANAAAQDGVARGASHRSVRDHERMLASVTARFSTAAARRSAS